MTGISADTRAAVRDLVLVLADSKRLLGMRYAGWILGAPELEAGIACASMAQDEWGHGRLLYALLRDFGDDVERLEHGRSPAEYSNIDILDAAPESWSELIALNSLADAALSVQFEAFRTSEWAPLRQRVEKLLDEEKFHAAHGNAWVRRLSQASDESRQSMNGAAAAITPALLRWFGPDSPRSVRLVDERIADAAGTELRHRFLDRVSVMLDELGLAIGSDGVDFDGFDESRRRSPGPGPDEETIRQVRGDRNRAFLMD